MFLLFPTVIVMLALPIGLRWKGADHAVRAVYLFHSSGDPIATVASDFVPPIAAEQLGPVLGAVRSFVETSSETSREFHTSSQRFGEEGLVAVRGRFVSACAVYRGTGDGALSREMARFVREFEDAHEANLGSWKDATAVAEVASHAMSELVASREAAGTPGETSSGPSSRSDRAMVQASRSSAPG